MSKRAIYLDVGLVILKLTANMCFITAVTFRMTDPGSKHVALIRNTLLFIQYSIVLTDTNSVYYTITQN